MSEKIIRIKSGNEEFTMSVTEEEYRNYFRPWWQMKKKEQRNREAMEQNGYTEESYEEWKENDMRTELFAESMEELAEKRMLLGVLQDAMDSLLPEERELAMKVFGEEMSIYKDLRILEKSIGEGDEENSNLDLFSLEMFENIAYTMVKHADPQIPNEVDEWLDGFNTFSIYQVLPQLIELWGLNVKTDVEAKKNFAQLSGK